MTEHQIIALRLTARGLVAGRSYEYKGVKIKPITKDGNVAWELCFKSDYLVKKDPIKAALLFMELTSSL